MKNHFNRIFICLTFRIQWIIILAFILYNCFQICGFMIVHAEMGVGGILEAPHNLAKPFEFPNPLGNLQTENGLVKGINVNYPKDIWNTEKTLVDIDKEIQRLQLIINNNRPDLRDVFIKDTPATVLRLNLLEKDMVDLLTYRNAKPIAILWDDFVCKRLIITNEEAKHLLCYLAVLEKEYIYIPEYTTCPVIYDKLYTQIKAFFPSPFGPDASKYYQDINSNQQNLLFIEANLAISHLGELSLYNPLFVDALVIKNQYTSLYTYSINNPGKVVSPENMQDMHDQLLKAYITEYKLKTQAI